MNIRKPRVGAFHVQEESRAFALLRQVLEELTRRHLLPTPGHYSVIFRRLVARQRGDKEPDAQTYSELVLCAHLVDALRGNFTENGWLSVQLKQLRSALGDESAEEEEDTELDMRIQRVESIIHSIAMNTARSLGDTQDFSQDCRRLMETLQTEVGSAIRTVSGADDAISDCSARLVASKSLEEGRQLFSELTQHVGQVSSQLRRTELMLGETNRNLATAMEQLEKSQLQVRELAYAAQHDPLTGALNRLGLENALSLCASSELTIILFGIDDFAEISLKHGTCVGEKLLKHAVHVLQGGLRDGDMVARQEGPELLVLLPRVREPVARQIADRLLKSAEAWNNEHVLALQKKVRMSLSGGIATCLLSGANPHAVLKMAMDVARGHLAQAREAGGGAVFPV